MQAIPLNKLPKVKMRNCREEKEGKGVGASASSSSGGGAGASGFRRDGGSDMNKAPNIEMIAKFAAEKEKYQRDIRAKEEQRRQQPCWPQRATIPSTMTKWTVSDRNGLSGSLNLRRKGG